MLKTQWMIPHAADPTAPPCLWLRGLLPTSLLTSELPEPTAAAIRFVVRRLATRWPSGEYFSDGPGGRYSSMHILRRRGCCLVRITEVNGIDFGAYFTLPGGQQTVPRSELYCVVVLCFLLVHGAVAQVASDSEITVVGIRRRQQGGDNYDRGPSYGRWWRPSGSRSAPGG